MNSKSLPLSQIRTDGGTQSRAAIDKDTVSDYAEDMRQGDVFPPITVAYDGTNYWLVDGFHRVEAAKQAGRRKIEADIFQRTLEDAQWESFGANRTNALSRSNDDKRRSIVGALKHKRGAELSNEQIARHCGVDAKTVAKYREELVATLEIPESNKRRGADGREINTSKIGAGGQHPQLIDGKYYPVWTAKLAIYNVPFDTKTAASRDPRFKVHAVESAGNLKRQKFYRDHTVVEVPSGEPPAPEHIRPLGERVHYRGGVLDQGAFDRAIDIARKLQEEGIWTNKLDLWVVDPYKMHTELFAAGGRLLLKQLLIRAGIDGTDTWTVELPRFFLLGPTFHRQILSRRYFGEDYLQRSL